jgi:hypothetical protein
MTDPLVAILGVMCYETRGVSYAPKGRSAMYYQDAWRMTRAAQRPVATLLGLRYSLLSGAFALLQVVISQSTSAAYQPTLITLLHVNDPGAGIVPPTFILPPVIVGAVSCLLVGIISVVISYYAAHTTAQETHDIGLGQRAGIIASLLGSLAWLVFSVVGTLWSKTDGFFLTADPFSATPVNSQLVGLTLFVAARAVILGAFSLLFAFLAASLGAQVGKSRP